MIRLYDTAAREKRAFEPADPGRITMYVCGPTVYGRAHIGNMRPAVVFDTLARLLRHTYGENSLVYARNVTDVDDKIIATAVARGVGYRVITEQYYQHYMDDTAALNVLPPNFQPRATAFIPRMIDFIERLIASGNAYVAKEHVLFDTRSDQNYGSLSRRTPESIEAGARVEVAPYKRHPADFVLWKPAGSGDQEVALSFDSPWGRGRPGWHIECSAMIEAFGDRGDAGGVETIDIHGGGIDLVFPHHENEAAQSRCAHGGAPLARYWLHNGFVDFGAEKMSKSLGNVVTPGELLAAGHKGEVLRLALLSAHYRSPLPWTEKLLEQSKSKLDRIYRLIGDVEPGKPDSAVIAALSDDLNTPAALAKLAQLNDPSTIKASANVLGLASKTRQEHEQEEPSVRLHAQSVTIPAPRVTGGRVSQIWSKANIELKIAERNAAKKARDFATADRIRDELKADGILLEDGPQGTSWRRA